MLGSEVFFTLQANSARFPDMDAVCGKCVAALRVSKAILWIAKWNDEHCTKAGKPPVIIVGTGKLPSALLEMAQGRVDAAADTQGPLGYLNSMEGNRYVTIGKPFNAMTLGIGFSKDDPELGQAIKKAIAALMADGTYHRLLHKWNVPEDSAIPQVMINGHP